MYNVIKFSGKGDSGADYVSVHSFDDEEIAKEYIQANTKKGKYWVYSEMMVPGKVYETYRDYLFDC